MPRNNPHQISRNDRVFGVALPGGAIRNAGASRPRAVELAGDYRSALPRREARAVQTVELVRGRWVPSKRNS